MDATTSALAHGIRREQTTAADAVRRRADGELGVHALLCGPRGGRGVGVECMTSAGGGEQLQQDCRAARLHCCISAACEQLQHQECTPGKLHYQSSCVRIKVVLRREYKQKTATL